MEFCPKCGSILVKKGKNYGCARCSQKAKGKIYLKVTEEINERSPVAVVTEKGSEVHPITDYKCEKCKNKKAYFWIRQMRSGDEPESKFYKCTKCKNVVRVDD